MTCRKVNKITFPGLGVIGKQQCTKPVFKDGLCAKHYKKSIQKAMNWIDRENYRVATADDILKGRSLKLCNTNQHILYRYRKGNFERYHSKDNKWIVSPFNQGINAYVELKYFCVTK